MKKIKRLFAPVFASFILLFMVTAAAAATFYVPNGDFESGLDNWTGLLGWQPNVGPYPECYSGNCVKLNLEHYYISQSRSHTDQYAIVGAWVSDSVAGNGCISVRRSGVLYENFCSSNGAGWMSECFAVPSGTIQIQLRGHTGGIYMDNVFMDSVAECPPVINPPTEPTELPAFAITATCSISYTSVIISGTEEVTQTETITVPANILSNVSFEEGGVFPDYWQSSVPLDAAGIYKKAQPSLARSGDDLLVVGRKPEVDLYQTITVSTASDYTFGGYTRYVDSNTNSFVFAMRYQIGGDAAASSVATCENNGSDVDCEYEEITNTTTLAPGSHTFEIYFPDNQLNPNYDFKYYVDDVFAIPVTGTNGSLVNCPAVQEHYNQETPPSPQVPPEGYFPVDTVGGIPIPIGGAGTVCYECRFPPTGILAEPAWAIAWLGCVIRNLFSCSLRVWLQEIANAVMGVYSALFGIANFARTYLQGNTNWVGSIINNGLVWYANLNAVYVVDGGESSLGFWDFFYAALGLIPATINSLTALIGSLTNLLVTAFGLVTLIFFLILGIVQVVMYAVWPILMLVFSIFAGFIQAVNAPPLTVEEFALLNGGEMLTGDAFTYFWWGIALVDDYFTAVGGVWFVWLLTALLGLYIAQWLIQEWNKGIMPS